MLFRVRAIRGLSFKEDAPPSQRLPYIKGRTAMWSTRNPEDEEQSRRAQLPTPRTRYTPVAPVDEVCIKGVDHGGPTRGLSAASEAEIATRTSRVGTYRALKVDEVGTAISPTLNAAS